MKGGAVRRHEVITIAIRTRRGARHITAGGQPLQGVRVMSDTANIVRDVDGNYALADLQTGSRTR